MAKILQPKKAYHKAKVPVWVLFFVCVFSVSLNAQNDYSQLPAVPNLFTPELTTASEANNDTEVLQEATLEHRDGPGKTNPHSNLFLPPPGNDNCAASLNPPYVLTSNSGCIEGAVRGSGGSPNATVEAGETFGCSSPAPTRTVWYSFQATQSNMWVALRPTGATVCSQNFGIVVYRYTGTCPPGAGSVMGCQNYQTYNAGYVYNKLSLTGLSIGTIYVIQITQNPGCPVNTAGFCIKIGTPLICNTCSTPCGPICQFGGPTPPTVPQVQSTCPSYPMAPPLNQNDWMTNCYTFTAGNDTVNMQQVIYAYCSPNTYSFTYTLYDNTCSTIQSGNVFSNNMITGLVIGTVYRICYTLQASCTWDSVYWPYLYMTTNALPVDLIAFDASAAKNKIELSWVTASETNSDEFIVERTQDAINFQEVGRLKAAGNSTSLKNYLAFDTNPLTGKLYYRLKQTDFDGGINYSKLTPVYYAVKEGAITIIPNPANDVFTIRFVSSENYNATIKISDKLGKTVYEKSVITSDGANLLPVESSAFSQGIYSVHLIINDQVNIIKFVKE